LGFKVDILEPFYPEQFFFFYKPDTFYPPCVVHPKANHPFNAEHKK